MVFTAHTLIWKTGGDVLSSLLTRPSDLISYYSPLSLHPSQVASLLFPEHVKHALASGPMHWLSALHKTFFPQNSFNSHSLASFGSWLKCHLHGASRKLLLVTHSPPPTPESVVRLADSLTHFRQLRQ